MVKELDKQNLMSGFKSHWVLLSNSLVLYLSKKLSKLLKVATFCKLSRANTII